MINDFIIELPGLVWDKKFLIDDLSNNWKRKPSVDNDGQYMSIIQKLFHTSEIKKELTKIAEQLPRLNINIDTEYHYLCTGKNNILMPHFDPDRPASLNIPILGDMQSTPIKFHTGASLKKESILFEHVYTCPTIINTTKWHSVINRSNVDRYILSISVFNTWDELTEMFTNSSLL